MPWSIIFKFLGDHIEGVVGGVLLAAALSYVGYLKLDNTYLHGQLDKDNKTIQTFKTVNTQLNGQITDQNKSITTLQKTGADYKKQAETAQAKADQTRATANQQLADMKKKLTPKDCDGAMQRLLDDAVKNGPNHS